MTSRKTLLIQYGVIELLSQCNPSWRLWNDPTWSRTLPRIVTAVSLPGRRSHQRHTAKSSIQKLPPPLQCVLQSWLHNEQSDLSLGKFELSLLVNGQVTCSCTLPFQALYTPSQGNSLNQDALFYWRQFYCLCADSLCQPLPWNTISFLPRCNTISTVL